DGSSTPCAEREAFDVLALRDDSTDGKCRRSGFGFGIADCEVTDAQCSRQIALKQERRSRERRCDVIESEIAAVARQQVGHIDFDAEKIAHCVSVFRAIKTMEDVTPWIVSQSRGRIETRNQRRPESLQLFRSGSRRIARGHCAYTELANDFFPDL